MSMPTAQAGGFSSKAITLIDGLSTKRHGQIGLALLRIIYGSVLIGLLIVNYGIRHDLWGPNGLLPWDLFTIQVAQQGSFSLYALADSDWWAEFLFYALFTVAVLFTLGWRTRVITPVLWVLVWSWHERNPLVLDGGDNLMRIILIYLVFADVSARFSLDARRAKRKGRSAEDTALRRATTVLHNFALAAVVFQVCVVYLTAGLFKVQGERWQQGTALYYILRVAEFSPWPELSRLIYENSLLVTAGTYVTVFFQVSVPLLLLNRYTRWIGFIMALGMHGAIGVLMGLPFFSAIMIATDLTMISDREYSTLKAVWHRARAQLVKLRGAVKPAKPIVKPAPLMAERGEA